MSYAQTAKLIFAVGLVLATIVLLGVTVKPVATAPLEPITRQIMRRKDRSNLPASAAEIAELQRKAQDKEKRDLKIRDFRHMPLKIHAIRNVDSDTWYKDLQIEVKNTGDKPIYFLLAYLEFPDHKPGGRDTALALTFGELKYVDISLLGDAQDRHLDPGQTYVFAIPEKLQKSLGGQHERSPEEFKKLDFHVSIISFGDRTGFEAGGDPVDSRKTKQPDGLDHKKHHGNSLSSAATRSPPQDACLSCSRLRITFELTCFNLNENEWCAPAPLRKVDSSKPCRRAKTTYYDCDDDPDHFPECPQDEIYNAPDCPGYDPSANPSPTPSPSPSPSPTCDPALLPNPTNCHCDYSTIPVGGSPQWICSCSYDDPNDPFGLPHTGAGADYIHHPGPSGIGGCPGFAVNNGSDCCICSLSSSDCAEGTHLDTGVCNCIADTGGEGGSSGGSGGGDPNGSPIAYKRECVDYVWVHFKSTDGGLHWTYDDRETYAGCHYVD